MTLKIHSVGVDPQKGFTMIGDLVCPGGYDAISRVAKLHEKMGERITSVDLSLDQHHKIDISHPGWWLNKNGTQIDPFTEVPAQDLVEGTYSVFHPGVHRRSLKYLQDLEAESLRRGRPRKHMVWPVHCPIGSEQAAASGSSASVSLRHSRPKIVRRRLLGSK